MREEHFLPARTQGNTVVERSKVSTLKLIQDSSVEWVKEDFLVFFLDSTLTLQRGGKISKYPEAIFKK